MKIKRAIFWSLVFASALAVLARILHVPYRPDLVLSAIPQDASFVTLHSRLARELPVLLENRVVTGAMASAGVPVADLHGLCTNRASKAWLTKLAGDQTTVAYVPSFGPSRRPAWVFASWIGNQSQILRWKVALFHPKDFRPVAVEYGRTIYNVRMRNQDPKRRLSVALVEGILVGCLSEDPAAARYLVQTFDRQYGRTSFAATVQALPFGSIPSPDSPHRGWLRLSRLPLGRQDTGVTLLCDARCPDTDHLELRLAAPGALPDHAANFGSGAAAPLANLLGDAPDCALVMPVSWLKTLVSNAQPTPLWIEALEPMYGSDVTNALAFAAILDRSHCGRIRGPISDSLTPFLKGLRVPTLVLGIQAKDETDASRRLMQTLDTLNTRFGIGLIPHNIQAPGGNITLIEETRKNLYGRFEPDERVAWMFRDGWVFLFSNAAVLKRRLASPSGANSADPDPWEVLNTKADAMAWLNVNHTSRLFKDAFSAITLSLLFRNPDGTRETRARLDAAGTWMERLGSLGQASGVIRSTNGWVTLELKASAAPSSPPELR